MRKASRRARRSTNQERGAPSKHPPAYWLTSDVESLYVQKLAQAEGVWGTYFASMPKDPLLNHQRRRALAVRRIVKAALDAFVAPNDDRLFALEKDARRVLRLMADDHMGSNATLVVDLRRYRNQGWGHSLGDPVSEKRAGREQSVWGTINLLNHLHRENKLTPDGFAEQMSVVLSLPFTDFSDIIKDWRVRDPQVLHPSTFASLPSTHPARIAADKARKACARWLQSERQDIETLFKAGLRAFGATKDAAAGLLKAEAVRVKRRGREKGE